MYKVSLEYIDDKCVYIYICKLDMYDYYLERNTVSN